MKIIATKLVDSDIWATLKATRRLIDSKGEADLFTGKQDGQVVAMIPDSFDEYRMVLVEFDPSWSEDLYQGYGARFESLVEKIWSTVSDFVAHF